MNQLINENTLFALLVMTLWALGYALMLLRKSSENSKELTELLHGYLRVQNRLLKEQNFYIKELDKYMSTEQINEMEVRFGELRKQFKNDEIE